MSGYISSPALDLSPMALRIFGDVLLSKTPMAYMAASRTHRTQSAPFQ